MRSGQHNNKRSRGRSRGRHPGGGSGGGGGNPINRVYESNGPEVKVRGTAQTVADKYLQLGRDAQASGDNVMAENFYQHAEHYLRILSAAQAYNQQYQQQQQQQQYRRPPGDEMFDEDETDEGGEGEGGDSQPQFAERQQYSQEQQPQAPVEEPVEQPQERESQPQPQQSRPRDYSRDRSSHRSNWDNRKDSEERSRQPHPRSEASSQPPASEGQNREAPPPAQAAGSKEGWDGPQPSFLKRPANGSGNTRSRSEKKPRRETAESGDAAEAQPGQEAPPVK